MLFLTKAKKFGMILIMSILLGILMILTGISFYVLIVGPITGLILEFIYRNGEYKSAKKAVLTNGLLGRFILKKHFAKAGVI